MLPRWKVVSCIVIVIFLVAFVLLNAELWYRHVPSRKNNDFNLVFRYGVTSRNELDTFKNTFTKDMVLDPPITVWLHLSDEEIIQIKKKMVDINFFNLPEIIPLRADGRFVYPQDDLYIKVQNSSTTKEVSWSSNSEDNANKQNLMQLANLIIKIIEERPEFKELPPSNGGYC